MRITDGANWVEVTPGEAAKLREERLIVRCTELGIRECPPGTHHLLEGTWEKIEDRLEEIRKVK
jgi:hypothetical protein